MGILLPTFFNISNLSLPCAPEIYGGITEISPSFQSTYQAMPTTLSAGSHRKGAISNDTMPGEFTNIPTVPGIEAVQNLFGGYSLGTPVFSGKDSSTGQSPILTSPQRHSDQSRWISQERSQSEVYSTHPDPQNATKSTIPQHIGDTKPDTTPDIAESKSESAPNSRKDKPESPPYIREETS